MLPWRRFVALGDSATEGVGDPNPDGTLRGWADRLAAAMAGVHPELEYVNLAQRGLTTREIREQQLGRALELRPDLASALSGMNDLLDPGFDPEGFEAELDAIVGPLRECGALVLTATFPDITVHSPLGGRFLGGVRRRLLATNDAVRAVSRRHGAVCLDVAEFPEAAERAVLSVDRLHPGPRGHLMVAQAFARLLEDRSGVPVPEPEETALAGRLAQARWLVRQFDPREVGRFVSRVYLGRGARTS